MIDAKAAPYGALLLRLAMGVLFIAHAYLKVFVFTMAGTEGFFATLGLPAWFAWLVTLAELGGGVLLILGLHARWIALAFVPILVGAAITSHGSSWVFSAEGGGWEYPIFWAACCIVQALIGDGALALKPARRLRPAHA
jgi:putative oxidoreductase